MSEPYAAHEVEAWRIAVREGNTSAGLDRWVANWKSIDRATQIRRDIDAGVLKEYDVELVSTEVVKYSMGKRLAVSPLAAFKDALDTFLNYDKEDRSDFGTCNGCDREVTVTGPDGAVRTYSDDDVHLTDEDDADHRDENE